MKNNLSAFFVIFAMFTGSPPAKAATVLLDTTTISFNASGSPNTIAGSWNAPALAIPSGASIGYFTVEISELLSDFGQPQSISFDSLIPGDARSLSFCINTSSCVAEASVGDIAVIDVSSPVLWAWDFMNRLVQGNNPQINSGNSTVAFSSGGGTANVTGNVAVAVYGDLALVPLPSAIFLMLFGIISLFSLGFRR